MHNQILKISRRYQGVMGKWKNKLRGNTFWCKKNIEVLCHTENRGNWKLRISRLENCYTEQELVILLLLQPFTPLHQNAYSPYYSLYISWSAEKENLFNNQELLWSAINSFILGTLVCDSEVISQEDIRCQSILRSNG